jgi:phospholipid/cholesterol/gamma-HCH transport system substrate-binding protein
VRRRIQLDAATLAVVVTLAVGAALLVAVNLQKIPFLHPSESYVADFASAGGISDGDDVRVAGVVVGKVSSVKLHGQVVRVRFTVTKGLRLGSTSSASIEIATVLGNVFLQVHSEGGGRLSDDVPIPVARTTVPFTLLDALGEAAEQTGKLDQSTLRKSLEQLSSTLSGISKTDVDATVGGLARLSASIGSRQDEISKLIAGAQDITDVLAAKSDDIVAILGQSDVFLRMLDARHDAVRQLLVHTRDLAAQVSSLIEEEGAPLAGALASVNTLGDLLSRDSDALEQSIGQLGKFSVNIANATGNGRWLDVYLPTGLIPDNVLSACGPQPKAGCAG